MIDTLSTDWIAQLNEYCSHFMLNDVKHNIECAWMCQAFGAAEKTALASCTSQEAKPSQISWTHAHSQQSTIQYAFQWCRAWRGRIWTDNLEHHCPKRKSKQFFNPACKPSAGCLCILGTRSAYSRCEETSNLHNVHEDQMPDIKSDEVHSQLL